MNNRFFLVFSAVLIIASGASSAQVGKPLTQPLKQPVLIDDIHTQSQQQAIENLMYHRVSVITVLDDLSAKQKKKIGQIEADRDKKLKQIDEQLAAKKERLSILQSPDNDSGQMDKTIREISKLAIKRQQTDMESLKKIRSQLTPEQLAVFDTIR